MGPLTVLLAGCLLAALPASGQLSALPEAAPRDSLREDFHRRLMLAIDPGDTQRVSLRDLRRRLQEELDLVRLQIEEGRITPQGGRVRYRQAIDAYQAGRDTVLTRDQLALIDRARRHQRDRLLDPGGGEQPRLAEALDLSRRQRRQWVDLMTELREEIGALRRGRRPSQSDYQRLHERYRTDFEAILTASQLVELGRFEQERERRLEQARLELLAEYGAVPDSAAADTCEETEGE